MGLWQNQALYIIEKLKPPMCAKCHKRVDKIIRRGPSVFEHVFEFRLQCHGEEELLKVDYEMLRFNPRFPLDDIVAFRGNTRKIVPESNINLPRPVARIISGTPTTLKSFKPEIKEEIKKEKKIKRLLNFDGMK